MDVPRAPGLGCTPGPGWLQLAALGAAASSTTSSYSDSEQGGEHPGRRAARARRRARSTLGRVGQRTRRGPSWSPPAAAAAGRREARGMQLAPRETSRS